MAVFLSPGVFPREIDLSAVPAGVGPLRPVFIGTAKKGPVNVPTFVSNAQQFIDTFGEPITESPLGFGVLNYMEEGNQAFILRIGVEAEEGQPDELASIAIDTSGTKLQGWGRIPLFQGIDFGRIRLRAPSAEEPYAFHDDAITNIDYNDIDVSSTDGPTSATLDFTGVGLSDTYLDPIDDNFTVLITSDPNPSSGSVMDGAGFEVIRNSDGKITNSGFIDESITLGTSEPIQVGTGDDDNGLIFAIVVTGSSPLETNDTFSFTVRPDNRSFSFSVQGDVPTLFSFADGSSYTDVDTFVDAFNALVGAGPDYAAQNVGGSPQVVTEIAGDRIQLLNTEAWALEAGVSQYVFDIPRSYLLSNDPGPYNITSANNRVKISSIGADETVDLEFSVSEGLGLDVVDLVDDLEPNAGQKLGNQYFNVIEIQVSANESRVLFVSSDDFRTNTLRMQANFSNIKTLRFAEELDIPFPYTKNFRGYFDPRVTLPAPGETTPAVPLSCEVDPGSDECAADTAYFANIVGFLVAKTPGTWVDDIRVTVELYNNLGDRFTLRIFKNGVETDRVDDLSFDPREERYIANVINAGGSLAGTNGNAFVEWESRPAFLNNDPADSAFEVRVPTARMNVEFNGQANGIPLDAVFSSELDRAIIGNPALGTGLFAFQNPEAFDVNLLAIPGVSSGAVIGQALQLCEGRGDMLYIVDPPFGLRSQQVVDWHNGMLFSDLSAAINSSFGALYWPWLKIFNQFEGSEIFVPPSGFVAGVFSRTAREREQWFAPAGLNRGILTTALDVEFNATQGERDLLYGSGNAVNPIVKFPQDGITVFGQRTLQRRATALDRVNVRMLLIFLKKNLIRTLRFFLFEPIDRLLFAEIRSAITPFLEDVMARRGLQAFKLICDDSNNTPETIDRNELHVAVLIKPTKAAEFIVLNLVILRTEQSFAAEEVLSAAGVVG